MILLEILERVAALTTQSGYVYCLLLSTTMKSSQKLSLDVAMKAHNMPIMEAQSRHTNTGTTHGKRYRR
jgi:hypothetical protein